MEQQLILDRYRPLEELGEGGYGTVVLAWDTRMQRRVAIKRMPLPRDSFGRPAANPPGLAEARTAAMLNHPAIVTVYDFETDADEALLIMEHVDGASLERILDALGDTLDLDEMAAVFSAVADALCFAHENGVLHLDIKPANILVMRDGRVKVADFGMAALSTALGHGVGEGGTLGYMPLEQLEGMRVSEATDEWALAAVTYECLTAENPFDDDTVEAAIVRLETLETPLPSEHVPRLPRPIDNALMAALGLRPSDRYPSIAEFGNALEPHLGDARSGRESLAELASAYHADDFEQRAGLDEIGLWDRLGGRIGGLLLRAVAAIESAWLAWAGLSAMHLDRAAVLGAVALVALAGALAPSLGTVLGLAAFAIGLFVRGSWVLGILVSVAAALWWWFFARRSSGAAVIPLAAPALGVVHLAPATPLLAGFSLAPLPAAAAALVGGLLSVLASALSLSAAPFVSVDASVFVNLDRAALGISNARAAFADPSTYVVLLCWVFAAFVMSYACRRATRLAAMLGAVLGTIVLAVGYVLAEQLAQALGNSSAWLTTSQAVSLAGSLTIVVLVAALGAPMRPEEEDAPATSWQESDEGLL